MAKGWKIRVKSAASDLSTLGSDSNLNKLFKFESDPNVDMCGYVDKLEIILEN